MLFESYYRKVKNCRTHSFKRRAKLPKTFALPYPFVQKSGRNYYRRIGRCNPKRCGAVCCKIIHLGRHPEQQRYFQYHLGKKIITMNGIRCFESICKHLKDGKCNIHENKPVPCVHFPLLSDDVYKAVRRKCGYGWVRITKREYERIRNR